jgi:uncharacterized membrane protein
VTQSIEPRSEAAQSRAPLRLAGIDRMRGLVMILMVLDHARDFYVGFGVDPTDLATTTPTLFFTRWITHFCAPGFVLLAGVSAFLSGQAKPTELRGFLLSRGLWLMFLELTVVRFGWVPEPFYRFTMLQVIWVLGLSMVLLAPLTLLPPRVVLALGVAGVVSHGLLAPIDADAMAGPSRLLFSVLEDPATFEPLPGHIVRINYALLPWLSVMAVGYGLGWIWTDGDAAQRRARLIGLGALTCLAFIVVRAMNGYGDPEPWHPQPSLAMTAISFLNCEKYPPSLDYLAMTLGPILMMLALLEHPRLPARIAAVLEVYGRVPLFFYVAHLYLLRPIGIACALGRFGWSAIDPEVHDGTPEWPLYAAYVAWLAALLLLYPACRWFGELKRRRSSELPWLRYL